MQALADMFSGSFGAAGAEVVLEDSRRAKGELLRADRRHRDHPLRQRADHKRVEMATPAPIPPAAWALFPARVLTKALEQEAMERIIRPTVETLAAEGMPHNGVLYAGLMLIRKGRSWSNITPALATGMSGADDAAGGRSCRAAAGGGGRAARGT